MQAPLAQPGQSREIPDNVKEAALDEFTRVDKDRDGLINLQETSDAMFGLGCEMSADAAKEYIQEVLYNGHAKAVHKDMQITEAQFMELIQEILFPRHLRSVDTTEQRNGFIIFFIIVFFMFVVLLWGLWWFGDWDEFYTSWQETGSNIPHDEHDQQPWDEL